MNCDQPGSSGLMTLKRPEASEGMDERASGSGIHQPTVGMVDKEYVGLR